MISNRYGIEIFFTAFKEACGDDKPFLDRKKFHYAIILLAKALYSHEEKNQFETMFEDMLKDTILTSDNRCKGLTDFNLFQ